MFEEKIMEEKRQGTALIKGYKRHTNKKVYIESYGCQMNFSDSEVVASILIKDGYTITDKLDQASLVLVNTCSIRDKAEQTVRKRLEYFNSKKKEYSSMTVGVLGCMAERLKHNFLEEEKIVGIWTERDLMFRAMEEGFDAKTAQLKDNMSVNLISANVDEQAYQLYDKFLGRRIRHLLIEEDGEYIGLLSVGDVMRANLQQKNEEFEELNHMVSLEYYENWKEAKSQR